MKQCAVLDEAWIRIIVVSLLVRLVWILKSWYVNQKSASWMADFCAKLRRWYFRRTDHTSAVQQKVFKLLVAWQNIVLYFCSVLENIKRFIERMLDPGVGTGAVDVYAWMFGCQFIVFLIIASSWSAFSSPEVRAL